MHPTTQVMKDELGRGPAPADPGYSKERWPRRKNKKTTTKKRKMSWIIQRHLMTKCVYTLVEENYNVSGPIPFSFVCEHKSRGTHL